MGKVIEMGGTFDFLRRSNDPLSKGDVLAARKIARMLLEIKAVQMRPDDSFTLTSGKTSPVYVDCRRIISHPKVRKYIFDRASNFLRKQCDPLPDAIAGGETAGIPFAAWLSERWKLPMLYVRKEAKGFGRKERIEGVLDRSDAKVLLVEDLASDGGSKISFIKALRDVGYRVDDAFVVFCYGSKACQTLKKHDVRLHALCDWHVLLETALADKYIDVDHSEHIRDFLMNYDDRPVKIARAKPAQSKSAQLKLELIEA